MTRWRTIALVLASAAVGALITLAVLRGGGKGGDPDDEAARSAPSAAESVTTEAGQTIVTIDAATAARSELRVAPLEAAQQSQSVTAYATAVDVRDLVDARSQLDVSRAQAAQARARLAAAQAEYARLKALHDDDRNISDRVLQEAEANVRAEEANAEAAAATARAATGGVEQRWGAVIANAFSSGASWVGDLIANRRVLVQVISETQPPAHITLQTPQGSIDASFVSPAVRFDPHVQGRSWFYLASAGNVQPGMNLTAAIGQGTAASGVVVPRDALVWTGGHAWVYVEKSANRFARTEVETTSPMADGFFVPSLQPGQRIVVNGAQQLLSEEAKPKVEE